MPSGSRQSSTRAVIFDMDGVLIDSEPLHFEALNHVLGREGHRVTPDENDAFLGWTTERMLDVLRERYSLRRSRDDYVLDYERAFLDLLGRGAHASPGVVEALDALATAGVPVAVASSSRRSWIDATLAALGIADRFRVIVSGDDVAHSKPDPEIFLLAARHLGVSATGCVVIEDSPNGVMAGRRAGMWVIGVRTPSTAHLTLDGADLVVDSLRDLDLKTLRVS